MPKIGTPFRVSAIRVPQAGMPVMKDLVPSIGSSTQTYSAWPRSLPYSSPTIPCSGKLRFIRERIVFSAARSAAVTGSNPAADPLSSTPSEVRKNGRIASPEAVASWSTKAAKSMAVMERISPPGEHGLTKSLMRGNRTVALLEACRAFVPVGPGGLYPPEHGYKLLMVFALAPLAFCALRCTLLQRDT